MSDFSAFGKIFILFGLVFVVLGIILLLSGRIPWLGKLPGDIHIKRDNFSFYFPILTCIVISIILTLLLWLIRIIIRK